MKSGFSIFLAAFAALGASWLGLVLAPTLQLGRAKQETVLNSSDTWPQQRTGEGTLGLQIYRANGCAACHTEQLRQQGVTCNVTLTSLGNHKAADFKEFVQSLYVLPELQAYTNRIAAGLNSWNGELPQSFLVVREKAVADAMVQRLNAAGVKAEIRILATGIDLDRGWGLRRSVAADYLYDAPVQLGSLRAGPDLAAIGVRSPDANWQLLHLYAPRSVVTGSAMPSFRYLFEIRKAGLVPSPEALNLPAAFAPAGGFEVVPTAAARELVAYLLALRADAPLYEAPFTPVISAKP